MGGRDVAAGFRICLIGIFRSCRSDGEAGIIREVGADGYAFNPALIRQTMYEQLSSRRRSRLHLAAGTALEQEPSALQSGRAAELSWHFLQGDDRKRALSCAVIAGDEAETVFAHRESERHYRTALELARVAGDPRTVLGALAALSRTNTCLGEWTDARRLLERARGLEGTVRLTYFEAWIHVALAYLSLLEGEWETASWALDHAAEATSDGGLRRMWPVIACLTDHDLLAHKFDSARQRLESLLNQDLDELAESSELLLGLAEAHIGLGDLVRAEELVDQGLARSGGRRPGPVMIPG